MLNRFHAVITKNLVDVHKGIRGGIHHTMITDEYNVHDFGEVTSLQLGMEILGELIDGFESCLKPFIRAEH